jgi:uncharacterized protein
MRRVVRALLWPIIIYLLLCSAAASFLTQTTLHPYRRPLSDDVQQQIRQAAAESGAGVQDVEITTFDRTPLSAWYIRPFHPNGDAVILLHGLGDNRLGTVGYAQLLLKYSYSVLMPDARAHGLSGGSITTYGVLERDDIREWFAWIEQSERPACIYGLGESMGAAQLLQAVTVEPNFCAVVAESSFANFREIAYDRMGQQFRVSPWVGRTLLRPVVEMALAYVRFEDRLDLARASPQRAVANTTVPVMLIHGVVDSNIPVYHSRMLKLENRNIQLWEVPGADHCGAISVARADFEQRVVGWFRAHKREKGAYADRAKLAMQAP